jgi:hypothetical protein
MAADWPFEYMSVYSCVLFKREKVIPAVRALNAFEKRRPDCFFSIEYPNRAMVYITRVPRKGERIRNKRVDRKNDRRWPFTGMPVGQSVTFGGDDAPPAVARIRTLKREHPELFFSVLRPHDDSVMITRVSSADQIVNIDNLARKSWPFKDMDAGQSIEFDVTFFDTESRLKIPAAAHVIGRPRDKKFSTKTRNTASGQRIITVTRIS